MADRPSRLNREGQTKFRSNEGNWSIAERTNGVGHEGSFLTIMCLPITSSLVNERRKIFIIHIQCQLKRSLRVRGS